MPIDVQPLCAHHRAIAGLASTDAVDATAWRAAAERVDACWADLPFAVIDCEATGPDPASDRLVDVAVVLLDDNADVEGEWSTLVNPYPGRRVDSVGASDIHRISPAELEGAPSFAEVADDLHSLLEGRIVVAHRAAFDVPLLWTEASRIGAEWKIPPAVCTWQTVQRLGLPGSLAALTAHFGIEFTGAHRALPDARAAAAVTSKLFWAARDSGQLLFVPEFGCAQPLSSPLSAAS